jgi:hypothetical protein
MRVRSLSINLKGKKPLGRPKLRCEDNIKNEFYGNGMWWCGLDSCGSRLAPVAGFCENGSESSGSI